MTFLLPAMFTLDEVKTSGKLRLEGVPRFSEVEFALMEVRLGRTHLFWPQSRTYFSTDSIMAYIMHCAVGCISVE
ncbi:hypothetical protein IFM47457_01596 [Aspergillus lentulus]|nr:hypothetical protein IFM47457_01596 [Aspergillus lentulus]